MWIPREFHIRARGDTPFERRQPGLLDALSAVLNPILGGTTTTTPNQPAPTTTAAAKPPSATTPSRAENTASPNAASPNTASPNTASPNTAATPVNNGGSTLSSNPPISNGGGTGSGDSLSSGELNVASSTAGSHTGTASLPSSSSAASGNKGGTSSGATSSGSPASGDSVKGSTASGLGSTSDPGTGSGSVTSGGESASTSGSGSPGSGDFIPTPSDVNTLGDANGKGNNTHGGAIAAAVVLLVLFGIGVVVFILRRRSRARRDDQANKWWFARKRISQSYGDTEALNIGTSSRRSSFATTIDQSNTSFLGNTSIPPPPPPMAEIGRSNGTAPTLVLDISADQNRFSIESAGSEGSQFLVVLHRESLHLETTTSARTESFPFPKPPVADRTSLYSKGSERSRGDALNNTSASSPSLTLIPLQPLVPDDPFADNNPFDDTVPDAFPDLGQIRIGTVLRPFYPQLHDELQVNIGDSVRILQTFDDGWALAAKIGGSSKQGFMPVECFHEPESYRDAVF